MPKQQHEHIAHRSQVAEGRHTAAGCNSSSQQAAAAAAAAWAWFEHGGGMCITPRKAEGLLNMAANRNAKSHLAGPSRFKKEQLDLSSIPAQHSDARNPDDAIAEHASRRRHSLHGDDLAAPYTWRFSSSTCRSAPTSPRLPIDEGPDDHGKTEDEEGGCEVDDQTSSLLDNFEVDAVCRQLHGHLSSSRGSSTPSSCICNAGLQGFYEAHRNHLHAHIRTRHHSDDHKLRFAGTEHVHHNFNDVVHRLLRLRIKSASTSSRRSTSATAAPAFCSSIATANSIVDHRHPPPPPRAVPLTHQSSLKPQETLYDRSNRQNSRDLKRTQLLETSDDGSGAAGHLHERAEFTASSHPRKSHPKMQRGRSEHEQLSGGAPPSRLHHSSKVLEPLMSRLPHMSALVGYNSMHGAPSTDDRVVCTNGHRHFHKHRHIHHHHHHYHHLQHNIHQLASQDAVVLLQDNVITAKNDGAHVLQPPKLYSFPQSFPPGGRPHHDYIAAQNPPSLHQLAAQAQRMRPAAANDNSETYFCPAPYRGGKNLHADLQAPSLLHTTLH